MRSSEWDSSTAILRGVKENNSAKADSNYKNDKKEDNGEITYRRKSHAATVTPDSARLRRCEKTLQSILVSDDLLDPGFLAREQSTLALLNGVRRKLLNHPDAVMSL